MTLTSLLRLADEVSKASDGFGGEFVFDPAHTEDHGIGYVGEFHEYDDRLMYVPADAADGVRDDNAYVIADPLESHVAEPMALMLNVARELATSISALLSPPPGALAWERPIPDNVAHDGACVTVPASWGGIRVTSDDARAMAVMLLLAADLAEEGK